MKNENFFRLFSEKKISSLFVQFAVAEEHLAEKKYKSTYRSFSAHGKHKMCENDGVRDDIASV